MREPREPQLGRAQLCEADRYGLCRVPHGISGTDTVRP